VVSCWKWHEQVQLTNFWKRKRNDKKVLAKLLQLQHRTILNTNEIKKAYLQNLRIEKSANSITKQQYYSEPSQTTNTQETQAQTRSWMFKRID
jgi:hypothetical protein